MKLLLADGSICGGVDALLAMARTVWWLRPLAFLARLPIGDRSARWAYKWVAANRYCLGDVCRIPPKHRRRHSAASTFFESP
jgi:predicted DCC family thiol-disulfide oxidoreductase YuxK